MEILDVAAPVFVEGKTYNEAVKVVASNRKIRKQTVMDKCTRKIGLNTEEFKEYLHDKSKLESFLIKKFPYDEEIILRHLRSLPNKHED